MTLHARLLYKNPRFLNAVWFRSLYVDQTRQFSSSGKKDASDGARKAKSANAYQPPALFKKILQSQLSKREAVRFIEQKFQPSKADSASSVGRVPISLILHYPTIRGDTNDDADSDDSAKNARSTELLMQVLAEELLDLKKVGLHPVILSNRKSIALSALIQSLEAFTKLPNEPLVHDHSDQQNVINALDVHMDVHEFEGLTTIFYQNRDSPESETTSLRIDLDGLKRFFSRHSHQDDAHKLALPVLSLDVIDPATVTLSTLDEHDGYLDAALTIMRDAYSDSDLFIERVLLLLDEPFWVSPSNKDAERVFVQKMLNYLAHSASISVFSLKLMRDFSNVDDAFNFLMKDWVRDKPVETGALASISVTEEESENSISSLPIPQHITLRRPYPILEFVPTESYTPKNMDLVGSGFMSSILASPSPSDSWFIKRFVDANLDYTIPASSLHLDLEKLQKLLSESFGKKLDVLGYLESLSSSVIGKRQLEKIIIVNDYQAAALLTREFPMNDESKSFVYLDKFAVGPGCQGTGLADILWDRVTLVPRPDEELVWRSRTSNPVNKWYFERSNFHQKSGFWTFFYSHGRKQTVTLDRIDTCREHCIRLPATFS